MLYVANYPTGAGGGMSNPMTTGGDIIYGGASGTPTRLANGTAGQVLTSQGTTLAPIWSAAGAGDMILASAQTNSGVKTFLDGTMGLRNVANTFTSVFQNAATAARTYTLKDASGTIAFTSDITGTNSGTNTGDQTSIVGISGTKAQFNTAVSDGDIVFLDSIDTITGVKTMTGLNVIKVASNGLTVRNPANTFDYTITGAAIAAARTLNLPLITGTDTLAVLGLAQTYTATQTFGTLVATTVNGNTFTTGTYTLTGTAAKTLNFTNTLTLSGTDSTTMTFPTTTATIARTDAAQTFTGTQTFAQLVTTNNAITATGNAATVPITSRISTVTNNSAATLTITITTASAVDGMLVQVRVLDFSAAAQTITWVNTENSLATAPVLSNGSTTLPVSVLFQYNNATSKWRCIAAA